jgi:16S rRNA (guanine527-N7)-methyltransferase
MKREFTERLIETANAFGVQIDSEQAALMYRHFESLIDANTRFNLTRITDPLGAAVRQYADSLTALPLLTERLGDQGSVVDVGTGGGFPGIPIAIARPDWSVTCIDSTGKKIRFLEEAITVLGLSNVTAIHCRAREWKSEERFDAALLRGVATIRRCLREARPLVRPGGWVVCYKSRSGSEKEFREAEKASGPFRVETSQDLLVGTIDRRLYIWVRSIGPANQANVAKPS